MMTFDVCYHPQTLSRGMESAAFLKLLVNTSIDGVDKALSQLDPSAEKVARGMLCLAFPRSELTLGHCRVPYPQRRRLQNWKSHYNVYFKTSGNPCHVILSD